MSFDDGFLAELAEALAKAGLQVVIIGNSAALLHRIPVSTQDVDLFVRDHPLLQKKLEKFAADFGVILTRPYEPSSKMIRASGREIDIDFVFGLSSRKSFESIRSRAEKVRLGRRMVWVASLEDIIAAKEAAGRPKDKAALPILKEALQVHKAAAKEKRKNKQ
ncbi:nucleotidyltransferase [candidate division KSB1 bacterium]|nr:nucleotidyltransferase [candidate division KSB1 bacterium]